MKQLPYLEDIYDMEADELQDILDELNSDMLLGENCQLPEGIETFEKYERKALKLKDCLELELEERSKVDDVISFFCNEKDFLDDDKFFRLDEPGPTPPKSNQMPPVAYLVPANKTQGKVAPPRQPLNQLPVVDESEEGFDQYTQDPNGVLDDRISNYNGSEASTYDN